MKQSAAFVVVVVMLAACSAEKKAEKAFRYGKYQSAIEAYKSILARDPNNGRANYYLAESYRKSNRIRESIPYYAKAGGRGINEDTLKLSYAKALQAAGQYAEARQQLEEALETTDNEKLKARLRREISGLGRLQELNEKKSYYRIKNLEAINTPVAEYSPVYLNNELYFTSARNNSRIFDGSGTPYTDLYKVETKGANVDVNTVSALAPTINEPLVNEGTIAFTPDGKTMVFAKGNTGKRKGRDDVDLYLSRFRNGSWTAPQLININQPNSWESTPALSPDGRTLYFSSNRKGGYGGLDLYSATMDSRGRFGRVRNLGADINTPGDEMFPFASETGQLYFSSDGHSGYGMLDIFVVARSGGKTTAENLGQPVNSTGDDFGIFLFRPDRGFFTSNREGGKGDDDIYTFVNEDPNLKVVNYYLQGVTYAWGKDSTKVVLPETKVTLLGEDGEEMQDFITGNDGKFLFRVYENENYTLIGETDGYLVERGRYTTRGKSVAKETLKELLTNVTLDTLLVLDKLERNKIFVLQNIYFGFDSAIIRKESARELDKLVQLLNDNPEIKIEMGSHTDSVGSNTYNIDLSQRRAQATVDYLIRKGIDTKRLVAKGYGETRPIARNTNPDGSDNPDGRQRNRRTEFKILEIGPMPEKKKTDDDDDKYFNDNNNEP
ncbi:MAG: OmpA family protein [Cyclobacteriaceae bacterium]|jgi:peptidoglycan-associated lipoprotein